MKPDLQIYQIYYLDSQRPELDPDFISFSNLQNCRPEWCEYWIFREQYLARKTPQPIAVESEINRYMGFLSWKFSQKTGISGADFKRFVLANPGYDVYFVHPYPATSVMYRNVWIEGETHHPRLLTLAQKAMDAAGLKIDLRAMRNLPDTAASCNFWIGNHRFWERYMTFSAPIFNFLEFGLSSQDRALLNSRANSVNENLYHPYIMERVFSTLLATDPSIKALGYVYSEEQIRSKYPNSHSTIWSGLQFSQELVTRGTLDAKANEALDTRQQAARSELEGGLVSRKFMNENLTPLFRAIGLLPIALFAYRKLKKLRRSDF